MCAYKVMCIHVSCMYAYRVVCAQKYGVMCMQCCQARQKSLGLVLLLLLEWTPVDPLCCCGRDC